MKTLAKAQRFIEHMSMDLKDSEDFAPFVIVTNDEDKEFFVGFNSMPTDPDEKDEIADLIMAICVIHGAVEVAFGSVAWLAIGDGDQPPSERPDRKEVVIVSAASRAGVENVSIASVVREASKVGVGLWEQLPLAAATGRFAEALHMGVKLSQKINSEARAFLSEQVANGHGDVLVASTAYTIGEARRSAMKLEKGAWEK